MGAGEAALADLVLEDSSGASEEEGDRGVEEEAALTDLDLDIRKFVWQRSIELLISIIILLILSQVCLLIIIYFQFLKSNKLSNHMIRFILWRVSSVFIKMGRKQGFRLWSKFFF